MNWFKWAMCWYHRRHIWFSFYDADGSQKKKCMRCSFEQER